VKPARLIAVLLAGGLAARCSKTDDGTRAAPSAASPEAPDIAIVNDVGKCVEIAATDRRRVGNLILLDARLTAQAPLGDCGCKSALASYTVVERVDVAGGKPLDYERVFGRLRVSPRGRRDFTFVLNGDGDVPLRGTPSLRLGCAPPD
jgi:hypothetical protein